MIPKRLEPATSTDSLIDHCLALIASLRETSLLVEPSTFQALTLALTTFRGDTCLQHPDGSSARALLIFCILVLATGVLAQSQATTGNIEGRVLDPKEAAVPGATLTATNQQTGLEKTATTNDEGVFIISFLPPGPYTVRADATGFSQAEVKDVIVTVGGKTPLDVTLSVGGASGAVTISERSSGDRNQSQFGFDDH